MKNARLFLQQLLSRFPEITLRKILPIETFNPRARWLVHGARVFRAVVEVPIALATVDVSLCVDEPRTIDIQ
jgi:hypothetical protein